MSIVWDDDAWSDYLWWQAQDHKTLRRLDTLLEDVRRNGDEGIGEPEPLKHGFRGYWSRRTTEEHRLACRVVGDEVRVAACRHRYGA